MVPDVENPNKRKSRKDGWSLIGNVLSPLRYCLKHEQQTVTGDVRSRRSRSAAALAWKQEAAHRSGQVPAHALFHPRFGILLRLRVTH